MDLVSREEFEAVKAMAVKAREEQEVLSERLAALEPILESAPGAAPKTAPKTAAKVKKPAAKARRKPAAGTA
jgi:BMFP domain-containing protein YqiC